MRLFRVGSASHNGGSEEDGRVSGNSPALGSARRRIFSETGGGEGGGEGCAAPGRWGGWRERRGGARGKRGSTPAKGALGEGRTHTGLTRLPLSFLYSPQPKTREGRRELGLTKNNNEITITKANPGARALAAPEPTVNKQSRQTVCQINSCLNRV